MPYTSLDHFIARMRFKAAYPHIRKGARVCDLGCGLDAAFLDFAAERIAYGVGVTIKSETALAASGSACARTFENLCRSNPRNSTM